MVMFQKEEKEIVFLLSSQEFRLVGFGNCGCENNFCDQNQHFSSPQTAWESFVLIVTGEGESVV